MKKLLKRISILAALLTMLCALTACDDEPVKKIDVFEDDYVIEHYTERFPAYEKIEYERITWTTKYFDIGPHEPNYRCVVSLTEDAAAKLQEEYEWTEAENAAFEFEALDAGQLGSGPWKTCRQFEKDTFKYAGIRYVYFDGKTIVFNYQVN